MIDGIEEDEIIQGLENNKEDPMIEELLGLVEDEDQTDTYESMEAVDLRVIAPESEVTNTESETEDRLLDQEIREKTQKNRDKMIQKYSFQHTVVTFKAGDIVMLRIPKEDLAPTDNRRIACLILDVPYYNRYRLRTKYGIITHLYPTNQLNTVPEELQQGLKEDIMQGVENKLPLHTIALLTSTADRVGISCNCKKRCRKTCRCHKNNVLCSIYCHAEEELDCGNLSGLKECSGCSLVDKNQDTVSLPTRKRARATTVITSAATVNKRPTVKKARDTSLPRQTRAQRQVTLSQYQELQPIVNRLTTLQAKKTSQLEISSSSSLSELEDNE